MKDYDEVLLKGVSRPEYYEEVTIKSNSVPIVLSIWKSKKEDPCIIFFPGTMTHPLFYEEFLNLLSLNGFNVIGVHLVCHGKSPRVKELYSFDEMLQNGKDAISYAIGRFNNKIFIMGSSQGGILTIALAGLDNRIKAAFPHNILIPALPDSICVTRFPNSFKHIYNLIIMTMKMGRKVVPRLQLHVSFYLDVKKVTRDKEIYGKLERDPIGFMKYPIYFLTSLFCADLKQVYDGSIKCPVVVLVGKKDPLFPFEHTKKVFKLIKAPHKEMLIFDEDKHLIMNECVDRIIDKIVCKVKEFV